MHVIALPMGRDLRPALMQCCRMSVVRVRDLSRSSIGQGNSVSSTVAFSDEGCCEPLGFR